MPVQTGSASPARLTRRRRPSRLAGAVLAAALGLLSACGDDDESDATSSSASAPSESSAPAPSESSAPTATESSPAGPSATGSPSAGSGQMQTLEVSAVDFAFELPGDDLSAGTYEITLTNTGDATHDLVVERDGEDVGASEQIGPGETSTFEVTLEAGEYVFYCSVGNHRQMGMEVPVAVTA